MPGCYPGRVERGWTKGTGDANATTHAIEETVTMSKHRAHHERETAGHGKHALTPERVKEAEHQARAVAAKTHGKTEKATVKHRSRLG
jgi:hypothetical protein